MGIRRHLFLIKNKYTPAAAAARSGGLLMWYEGESDHFVYHSFISDKDMHILCRWNFKEPERVK